MKNLLMENDKLNEKKEEITKDINDTIEKRKNGLFSIIKMI